MFIKMLSLRSESKYRQTLAHGGAVEREAALNIMNPTTTAHIEPTSAESSSRIATSEPKPASH
jgi:hypothetical protein